MSLDRGIIDQQLRSLGESTQWWEERELRDLPTVMHADERILAISRGRLGRARWASRSWLIVVTQQRLLFMRSGRGGGWRQIEVATDRMERVALRIGPLHGRVLVSTPGQKYRMLVPRAAAYRLESVLSSLAHPSESAVTRFAPGRMMHRVVDHVLALPAVALAPPPARTNEVAAAAGEELRERVDALEAQVQELQQQIEFLEQLLRKRQHRATVAEALPPR